MTARARTHRELLRPEDATSLEEFNARKVAEQLTIRGSNGSWKTIGLTLLCSLIVVVDIIVWFGFTHQPGNGKWAWFVVAVLLLGLFFRIFGRIELRGARGSKRYVQLSRLSREWQARADRGEIPRTTPGGPKAFRDEVSPAGQAEPGQGTAT